MPATARMLARKLKLHGYQTARLMEPELNIRIGGTYLGELYARFQHPALALASYNAGPGAVSGWLKARGSLPLDAFVEEIPLDETRGYVKRCLRSFAAYQFLYSNGRMPALARRWPPANLLPLFVRGEHPQDVLAQELAEVRIGPTSRPQRGGERGHPRCVLEADRHQRRVVEIASQADVVRSRHPGDVLDVVQESGERTSGSFSRWYSSTFAALRIPLVFCSSACVARRYWSSRKVREKSTHTAPPLRATASSMPSLALRG